MTGTNILMERKRLTKLTEELTDFRMLYIQAPAGYGKTTFAQQWLAGKRQANAMVTLDAYDNTVEDICLKLKKLLEDLSIEACGEKIAAYTGHPDFYKAPMEFLMRAAAVIPGDTKASVVMDDFHYLTDTQVQKVVRDFLSRLPSGVRICILSRSGIPELFGSMVLKHEVGFIPQEQLLFDSQEIGALYKSRQIPITKKEAEDILAFTEGWPIGISALLLSEHHMPTENLSIDWLEGFLKTQVFEILEEEYKEFMIDTCMEDVLSEGLCNALTRRSDSRNVLEHLSAKGAFISGQRGETYRFHSLFLSFLRQQFAGRSQEYRMAQMRAAGDWYQKQNDFYHAVKKFYYIKDYDRMAECFDLLEEIDRAGFDADQVMRAVRDTVDEEMLARYPYLYFMMAFTARNEGQIETFKEYADQYYSHYPQIVERNPELGHNIFFCI